MANIAGTMRPGLLSGIYPERKNPEPGFFERSLSHLSGALQRFPSLRSTDLSRAVTEIKRRAEPLSQLESDQLNEQLRQLQRNFRLQGLEPELCLQSFALISEVAARTLQLRHYDVQLMAAWAMLHGELAEQATGEGKTLTATLTAATAALAGIPVHVLTSNEYLVQRDAELMGPLYRALGLSVAHACEEMTPEQRRAAYACDITYVTNKLVAFDYLRDRLLLGGCDNKLKLQLEGTSSGQQRSSRLLLRGLCFAIVDEADSMLIDEASTPLILTRTLQDPEQEQLYRWAAALAETLQQGQDFLFQGDQQIQLTHAGQTRISAAEEGCPGQPRLREELVLQALKARHLLRLDRDYLLQNDKVQIIDPHTGRTMPDRSWQQGLQQLVEIKENCPLSGERELLGRLTYQQFFRRYLHLCGMTGTAREAASELHSVYGLRVRPIPLHSPCQRRQLPTRIYPTVAEQWQAVVTEVSRLHTQGQPVLIGTGSVADSEQLSTHLNLAGLSHNVLNARQNSREAEIIARAGQSGQITVATNIAGRGTDIPLGPGVADKGGLHLIMTRRYASTRIDRQLYGRCARQGDPGSYQALLSLEDPLLQQLDSRLTKFVKGYAKKRYPGYNRLFLCVFSRAQHRMERRHRQARRNLQRHDRHRNQQLAFSGKLE